MIKGTPFCFESFLLFFVLLFSQNLYGQDKPMMVYDLQLNTFDSLPIILNSPAMEFEHTEHHLGSYDDLTEDLEASPPMENIYPGTQYSRKQKAISEYDLTRFPLRTSIKIFSIEDGIANSWCSGSLVSPKHILTAAHCVLENGTLFSSIDSILVCPIYDQGEFSSEFDCSLASKLYFIKDWVVGGEDIALVELEEPIGLKTGWLGMGFNNKEGFHEEGIYYKFSYPGVYLPALDSIAYNGDTLYYSYRKIEKLSEKIVGVNGANGIPGESGSSLSLIENDEQYTTYGVLSFGNYAHTRLRDWMYFTFKDIIAPDITAGIKKNPIEELDLKIYPNPVEDLLSIESSRIAEIDQIDLVDNYGRIWQQIPNVEGNVDVSELPNGLYYLNIQMEHEMLVKKIIKTGGQ